MLTFLPSVSSTRRRAHLILLPIKTAPIILHLNILPQEAWRPFTHMLKLQMPIVSLLHRVLTAPIPTANLPRLR